MLRWLKLTASAVAVVMFLPGCAVKSTSDKDGFADSFSVRKQDFGSSGRNDYFILEPGYQHVYEGGDERLVITVLPDTKTVDGVETRIVEERESVGGKIVEVSRNFFAIDKSSGDVYYFGEEVDDYKDGKIAGHSGAWLSGKEGARFGLFMPAKPVVGQKFYQEIAPKVAMDRCEVVSLNERVKVPAGEFDKCLKTRESTPLERGSEHKLYAPGVGLLVDQDLKLIKHGQAKN